MTTTFFSSDPLYSWIFIALLNSMEYAIGNSGHFLNKQCDGEWLLCISKVDIVLNEWKMDKTQKIQILI